MHGEFTLCQHYLECFLYVLLTESCKHPLEVDTLTHILRKMKCRNGEAKELAQGHSGCKRLNQVSKALGRSLVSLAIKTSSTYWSKVPSYNCRSISSLARAFLKMVGAFLNPGGKHDLAKLLFQFGLWVITFKSKKSWDSGLKGVQ